MLLYMLHGLGESVHVIQKVCGRRPPPSTSDYK